MQTVLQQLNGYQINEYKVIISPHEDLCNKITYIRKFFHEKFKTEQPVKSHPEVLLVSFKQLQVNEQRIIDRLKLVGMAMPPVKVEVKDFGSFPSHTIFLNITSKIPIGNLVKKIREDSQRLMKLDADNKPHFMTDSYITIARKLKPWQYEGGWLECRNKHFTGRFIATRFLLLKRRVGEFGYKTVGSFELNNMPIETKQGELF